MDALTVTRPQPAARGRFAMLMLGATGVVFGDIGTSPLYTLKEVFNGHLAFSPVNVLGILSLVFWSLMIVVTLKYVFIIMRADNEGEGGVLALSTLAQRGLGTRATALVAGLGMLGMALFTGDSLITPAISVLSAVEGLGVAAPSLVRYVLPITLAVLVGLFMIQSRGTDTVGKLFGPVMVAWFSVLGLMGLSGIAGNPQVLLALNPAYAVGFFAQHGLGSFLVLGSVVLAVTGGEALYADMGHFGRNPIKYAWLFFVLPCLVLNYFGQGALLISDSAAVRNPFFLLAPGWAAWPLLILATAATVIASQAVISGAFSLTRQAIHLNFLPRREVRHTSGHSSGQVYIPRTNWLLMVGVVMLVLGFRSSDALASAYGISVVGAMTIDAVLAFVVAVNMWKWNVALAAPLFACLVVIDVTFLGANLVKIPDGGWFPILIAAGSFTTMFVWRKGRRVLAQVLYGDAMPVRNFVANQLSHFTGRSRGTAIFLTGDCERIPVAFLHNIKHNGVLHERVVFMTVQTQEEVPFVDPDRRVEFEDLGQGFYRLVLRFGFMDRPDVPAAMKLLEGFGFPVDMMTTSFFLGRETLKGDKGHSGLNRLQEPLFIGLSKTATSATDFFSLPPNRVVELGSQVYI